MVLVYHNITPPEYFIGVHHDARASCASTAAASCGAYVDRCDSALGDSEYNRQELEALGFPAPACCRSCPTSLTSTAPPDSCIAGAFDDEWTNMLFVGRMIPNKQIEDVIRIFHAYKRCFNPRSRLLLVGSHGGFETLPRDAARSSIARARHAGRPLPRPRHATRSSTAYYDVADLFLCASEHEGLLRAARSRRSTSACRCWPTRPPPCRRRWTAAACSTTRRTRSQVAALIDASLSDHDARGRDRRRAGRGAGAPRGQGLRRHAAAVRRPGPARAPRARRTRRVAFDFWAAVRRSADGSTRAAAVSGLPPYQRDCRRVRRGCGP